MISRLTSWYLLQSTPIRKVVRHRTRALFLFSLGASDGAGDATVAQEAEEDVDDEGPEIPSDLGAGDEGTPNEHKQESVERPPDVAEPTGSREKNQISI